CSATGRWPWFSTWPRSCSPHNETPVTAPARPRGASRPQPKLDEERAMLRHMRIGRRLMLAFGLVLVMMALVGATSYWSLASLADLGVRVINVDSPLVENSQRVRGDTLSMRRFEKDFF